MNNSGSTPDDTEVEPLVSITAYQAARQTFLVAVQDYYKASEAFLEAWNAWQIAIQDGAPSTERRAKKEVLRANWHIRNAALKVMEAALEKAKAKGKEVRKQNR